ncbi:MAG: hypothetical protein CL878_00480 [Dehalococcoidia bacterium]|nr:hypothetical protein [Dehalococcoidia bacterium]
MKVAVVAAGRYWAGELAEALYQQGALAGLYTADPRRPRALPARLVHRFPWFHLPVWWAQRAGHTGAARVAAWPAAVAFDRWAARTLAPADVVVALAGFGLHTLRRARRRCGALTVCDRGSTHTVEQQQRLQATAARYALPFQPTPSGMVGRELAEYAEADLITVPSSVAWRSFRRQGIPSARLARVPFGVDLVQFSPANETSQVGEGGDTSFRVLSVGQLSVRKGIPDLLAALAPLHGEDLELAFVGALHAEVRPVLRYYAGQFRWLGHRPERALPHHYRRAAVFVLASVEEGLARVLLQALACGVPVVATDASGAGDVITDDVEGFVVPTGHPEALRQRVLQLRHDPALRERMSAAARARALQLGDWAAYGDRAYRTYSAALCRRTGARERGDRCA